MNIKVKSPANIAFIKYWGQADSSLVLPYNDSFSMTLSNCVTELELERVDNPAVQEMQIKLFENADYAPATIDQLSKVQTFYNTTKKHLKTSDEFGYKIKSSNSFPMKAGIASSAAFFSALAYAFSKAFNANLDTKELSVLARLSGSGSACRSIPDGFVWWYKGSNSQTSFAESIAPPDFWDIADIVLVVSTEEKKTGSQEGHRGALSSPSFKDRLEYLKTMPEQMKKAFMNKDFTTFGTLVEEEAYNFSNILMTQNPPLRYWTAGTLECIKQIGLLRKQGTECYLTIDAGANIHLICQKENVGKIEKHFQTIPEVRTMITNYATIGTHHL